MERRSRGRAGAWFASVTAHALLALALLALPGRPPPEPPPRVEGVELVWLDEVRAPPPGPAAQPEPSSAPAPSEHEAAEVVPPAPQSSPRSAAAKPQPSRDSQASTPPPVVPGPPAEGGIALSGLRGQASARSSGSGSVVPPTSLVRPPPPPQGSNPRRPTLGPVALLPDDEQPQSMEEAGFRKRKDGSYKFGGISSPLVAIVRPDGRVRFRDRLATASGTSARTNLLPAQKLAGEQQFRSLKTKILRQTAELRMQMARSWSKKQLRTQLAALSAQLKTTWKKPSWPLERRRKHLFLLWDECEEPAEDGPGSDDVQGTLDEARTAAGAKARAMIVRFIRDELPAGSDDAYPATELRALNGIRASRQRFAPYGAR